jgi:hypothetical protein
MWTMSRLPGSVGYVEFCRKACVICLFCCSRRGMRRKWLPPAAHFLADEGHREDVPTASVPKLDRISSPYAETVRSCDVVRFNHSTSLCADGFLRTSFLRFSVNGVSVTSFLRWRWRRFDWHDIDFRLVHSGSNKVVAAKTQHGFSGGE